MAVATKLNLTAAPFPGRPHAPLHLLAPPAPPPFALADAAFPPQFPFVTYCCFAAPPAGGHIGFCFPAGPLQGRRSRCGGARPPAAQAHGGVLRPRRRRGEAAGREPVEGTCTRRRGGASPGAGATAAQDAGGAAEGREEHGHAQAQAQGEAQGAHAPEGGGQRSWRARRRRSLCTRLPDAAAAVRWWTKLPEPALGWHTHIPNKLRSSHMIELLDEHCKFANEAAGKVVSAYDVLYLPMDFKQEGLQLGLRVHQLHHHCGAPAPHALLRPGGWRPGSGWTVYG
ncbi:unnamed protein product [Urochloa decumbens]|uniref:Uncharacterized protein n=1 Tax=Urochloa decumbens TaxID=240449 RepID=A0ABC9EL69_9POAL